LGDFLSIKKRKKKFNSIFEIIIDLMAEFIENILD